MPPKDEGGPGWFGSSWGAPANQMYPEIPVPFGALCHYCEEMVDIHHQGLRLPGPGFDFFYHLHCWSDGVLKPGAQRPSR